MDAPPPALEHPSGSIRTCASWWQDVSLRRIEPAGMRALGCGSDVYEANRFEQPARESYERALALAPRGGPRLVFGWAS